MQLMTSSPFLHFYQPLFALLGHREKVGQPYGSHTSSYERFCILIVAMMVCHVLPDFFPSGMRPIRPHDRIPATLQALPTLRAATCYRDTNDSTAAFGTAGGGRNPCDA